MQRDDFCLVTLRHGEDERCRCAGTLGEIDGKEDTFEPGHDGHSLLANPNDGTHLNTIIGFPPAPAFPKTGRASAYRSTPSPTCRHGRRCRSWEFPPPGRVH